jgi:hypothetical protein
MSETDDDELAPETHAAAREMVEQRFLELQAELGLTWAQAAHALVAYGIDAVHINPGPDGTAAELALMAEQAVEALVAVARDTEDRKARWKAN